MHALDLRRRTRRCCPGRRRPACPGSVAVAVRPNASVSCGPLLLAARLELQRRPIHWPLVGSMLRVGARRRRCRPPWPRRGAPSDARSSQATACWLASSIEPAGRWLSLSQLIVRHVELHLRRAAPRPRSGSASLNGRRPGLRTGLVLAEVRRGLQGRRPRRPDGLPSFACTAARCCATVARHRPPRTRRTAPRAGRPAWRLPAPGSAPRSPTGAGRRRADGCRRDAGGAAAVVDGDARTVVAGQRRWSCCSTVRNRNCAGLADRP